MSDYNRLKSKLVPTAHVQQVMINLVTGVRLNKNSLPWIFKDIAFTKPKLCDAKYENLD